MAGESRTRSHRKRQAGGNSHLHTRTPHNRKSYYASLTVPGQENAFSIQDPSRWKFYKDRCFSTCSAIISTAFPTFVKGHKSSSYTLLISADSFLRRPGLSHPQRYRTSSPHQYAAYSHILLRTTLPPPVIAPPGSQTIRLIVTSPLERRQRRIRSDCNAVSAWLLRFIILVVTIVIRIVLPLVGVLLCKSTTGIYE